MGGRELPAGPSLALHLPSPLPTALCTPGTAPEDRPLPAPARAPQAIKASGAGGWEWSLSQDLLASAGSFQTKGPAAPGVCTENLPSHSCLKLCFQQRERDRDRETERQRETDSHPFSGGPRQWTWQQKALGPSPPGWGPCAMQQGKDGQTDPSTQAHVRGALSTCGEGAKGTLHAPWPEDGASRSFTLGSSHTHYRKTAVLSSGKTPLPRLAVEPQASSCALASLLLSEAAEFKHKTEEQDPARQTSRSKGPGARRGPGALSEALPQGGRRPSSHPG